MYERLIRELPKGLLKWYDFQKGARALFVESGRENDSIMSEVLSECGLCVTDVPVQEVLTGCIRDKFSYIVLVGALECCASPVELLHILKECLLPDGRLLIGAENRFGIRYFCGDKDPFSGRNFDGLDNYIKLSVAASKDLPGRAYTKEEYTQMLEQAGIVAHRFYSVMPGLEKPQILYAEDYVPKENMEIRIVPQYHSPDTVFIQEEKLYADLIKNGMFHAMANGYLIECSLDGNCSKAWQVTVTMDRKEEYAQTTIVRNDGLVEKRALYPAGISRLRNLLENAEDLKQHNVRMVEAKMEQDSLVMPYVDAELATTYFDRLLRTDTEKFLQKLDEYWALIQASSEHMPYEEVDWDHFEPDWEKRREDDPYKNQWREAAFGTERQKECLGVILKKGYIDLISLNCFVMNDEFIFFDQEFYVEQLPAKVILWRTLEMIYWGNQGTTLDRILPKWKLFNRYSLGEYGWFWRNVSWNFIDRIRSEQELAGYYQRHRRELSVVDVNRLRMNYTQKEYDRIFRDIFSGIEGRKLYVFGAGNYAKRFLELYGKEYEIEGILDNQEEKWGTMLEHYQISSPELLRSLPEDSYRVIICVKYYEPVIDQMIRMGVREYGVFDVNLSYPRKTRVIVKGEETVQKKKYQVGYIAGVFDLFHVGHLNLFKRAKELCEYLIVGVVTDYGVRTEKRRVPYVPFEERIELVRSCRYVDEAVEIPEDNPDTEEAFRRYQFDVQFSGSDYANDPIWLAKKDYLQKHGADLVFFPYTQSTSSTKLKAAIDKKMLQQSEE